MTLFSSIGTDLVADVVGYFTGASAAAATTGLFVPVVPERLADSRSTGTVVAANKTITVPVAGRPNLPDPPPTAIAGTLTATETSGGGFAQVFPTGGTTVAGSTSTLNWNGPGRTQAVATIVGAPRGSVSLFTSRRDSPDLRHHRLLHLSSGVGGRDPRLPTPDGVNDARSAEMRTSDATKVTTR